ncbi:TPA: hypothetical protein KJV97_004425, partial [Shigella flexneri]|nr:hypothetical protein [Shigella flexneri]
IFETHVSENLTPQEVIADQMTVHVVPSYLLVDSDFFVDRREAVQRMTKVIKGINEKYSVDDTSIGPPSPDPIWAARRPEREILYAQAVIEKALTEKPELTRAEIDLHKVPIIRT